jgi:hypothetical protein
LVVDCGVINEIGASLLQKKVVYLSFGRASGENGHKNRSGQAHQ